MDGRLEIYPCVLQRPDTQGLPQSKAGEQGPYSRFLDYFGRGCEPKDCKKKKEKKKVKCDGQTDGWNDVWTDERTNQLTNGLINGQTGKMGLSAHVQRLHLSIRPSVGFLIGPLFVFAVFGLTALTQMF